MRNLLALLLLLTPAWAGRVYTDGTFDSVSWEEVVIRNDSNGVTYFAQQELSGGNPGAHWSVGSSIPSVPAGTNNTVVVAFLNPAFTWDPATDGLIASMQFSFDLKRFSSTGYDPAFGGFFRPVIRQDGTVYSLTTDFREAPADWTQFDFALTPGSPWTSFSGGLTPDFTVNGGLIEFGFRVNMGGGCSGASGNCLESSLISGLDNYSARIAGVSEPGPGGEIPEPGTVALLGAGLFGMLLVRRRVA